MMQLGKVDRFDLAILSILQNDASVSVAEVAERVNLSANPCWRRIKRLEDDGYIRKRVALLDAAKLSAALTVFVTVKAMEHSEAWLATFAEAVMLIPEVVEFYRMSGTIDYLLKLQVKDVAAYDRVYKRLIHSTRLAEVTSAFAMEEIKRTTEIPLPSCMD